MNGDKKKFRLKMLFIAFTLLYLSIYIQKIAIPSTFYDASGRAVEISERPQRIVSLAPSITEILYSLGLGDKVVGVTKFSNYPPEATLKPKVGSYIDLNVERILTLSPDLVIGTKGGNDPKVVTLLEQAGIPVFITDPRNLNGLFETLLTIGELCGVKDRALILLDDLRARVKKIINKTKGVYRPKVFLQINLNPIMSVNRETLHHEIISLAGGRNIMADAAVQYPVLSIEEVIKRAPEIIIISSMERGGRFEEAKIQWYRWKAIPAVKMGKVYLFDSDLIDRPSPRIVDALEKMAKIIHPTLFK